MIGSRLRATLETTGLYLLALLVYLPVLCALGAPGTMDAMSSFDVAQNLANGLGLVEDTVWNWFRWPDALTHPACTYWMTAGA